jgi:hypothetical protein
MISYLPPHLCPSHEGHVPAVLVNRRQNAMQVHELVLDVVTRGILEGKHMQGDDERRDIILLQGDGHRAIADISDVTNGTLRFTDDHLDPVSNFDRILSVSRPY